jgi:polysaccharide deacetylase 2 family uncharacterized protein YibQ
MSANELTAPLGQRRKSGRGKIRIPLPYLIAGALTLFLGLFVVWAFFGEDPFGGEPMAVAPTHLGHVAATKPTAEPAAREAAGGPAGPGRYDGPAATQTQPPPSPSEPSGTRTVNIINGRTGDRQEVTIPAPGNGAPPSEKVPIDQQFVETTPQGIIPKIATDGVRPADAFAQPVNQLPGKPNAPRIALIVGGLGVSMNATADAIAKLPAPVTLAFVPYGSDAAPVARARGEGHEVLLQVPMEPFDYPDNDPGPQTLLTSLAPQQNMERLYWLMSRFQGYVGIINMMGARFTASEPSFAPILRETAKRGLIFVDDGSNPRSVAGRIAGANNLPFVRAEVVLDSVPTPAEIDRALGRLEMTARERNVAIGIASALPVSVAHIAKWAKAAESRGLLLVPITAVAMKPKQS